MSQLFSLSGNRFKYGVLGAVLLISIANAFLLTKYGIGKSMLIVGAMFVLPMIYFIVIYPKFGILVLLIASYIIMGFTKLGIDFPVGTIIDGLQLLLIIGFFITQKIKPNWTVFKNPITILIILWIVYNLLQILNPVAESKLAWLYTIRSTAVVMLMYFVFMLHIKSVDFIRSIFAVWIGLTLIAALYAFKQEHLGFFKFEEDYLNSSPRIANLLFIGGQWRKFSFFSDPVALSFNMVIGTIFCLTMLIMPLKTYQKIILVLISGLFIASMIYSGTRAAYVLLPLALAMLVILKFNRTLLLISASLAVILVVLIKIPTSNYNLYRFQSAFKPSDDASFNVRKFNQKRIQPFIQSHPIGGGLGATGTWGERFAPDSYLAKFPPDSGYTRVAVEVGYIGLFLFCTLMFIILKTGIQNYYIIKDPELKNYCLIMVLIVFTLSIANYPQESLVQFPISVYFYLFVALINITLILDKEKQRSIQQLRE